MILTTAHVLHAFSFTLGCVAIHSLRSHADGLTMILTGIVIVLTIATIVIGIDRLRSDVDDPPASTIDITQVL